MPDQDFIHWQKQDQQNMAQMDCTPKLLSKVLVCQKAYVSNWQKLQIFHFPNPHPFNQRESWVDEQLIANRLLYYKELLLIILRI